MAPGNTIKVTTESHGSPQELILILPVVWYSSFALFISSYLLWEIKPKSGHVAHFPFSLITKNNGTTYTADISQPFCNAAACKERDWQ